MLRFVTTSNLHDSVITLGHLDLFLMFLSYGSAQDNNSSCLFKNIIFTQIFYFFLCVN